MPKESSFLVKFVFYFDSIFKLSILKTYITYIKNALLLFAMLVGCCLGNSCSTGIESTKTIKMNKDDLRQMEKSEEQKFATSIAGLRLADWKKGKTFMALSNRTLYLFDPSSAYGENPDSLRGKVLRYEGVECRQNPDLMEECLIVFSDGNAKYRYATGKTLEAAMKEIDSSKLPLLSDLDLISEWKAKLSGKKLWTRSNLWYDASGHRKDGLKYADVEVLDIIPATGDFPMNVKVIHENDTAFMRMNYTSDMADSRNFAALFFLSDPKNRYPNISAEHWKLIQSGKVGLGMTKDECRLALGNPDDVRAGHSTSQTVDIWQYSDGIYLFFSDGLLSNFRQ